MFSVQCNRLFPLTLHGHRDHYRSRYAEEGAAAFGKTCEREGSR
jgi:hypothetical protein